MPVGKQLERALREDKEEEASAPKEDQIQFIAQLLDFSRNGGESAGDRGAALPRLQVGRNGRLGRHKEKEGKEERRSRPE